MRDNNSYSLVDLAISLMVIFILLFIMMLNKAHQDYVKSTQKTRENLVNDLQTKNINAGIDRKDPLSVIFNIADDKIKFDKNKFYLLPAGEEFLDKFIPEFASTVCDKGMYDKIQSVQIIGHTDSDGSDEHNLELSQQRALSVMMYALNKISLEEDQRDCLLNLISINGRGERELVFDENGIEDQDRSRRVEFKIRVKSYEEQRQILKNMEEEGALIQDFEDEEPEENSEIIQDNSQDEVPQDSQQSQQQEQDGQAQDEPQAADEDVREDTNDEALSSGKEDWTDEDTSSQGNTSPAIIVEEDDALQEDDQQQDLLSSDEDTQDLPAPVSQETDSDQQAIVIQ